MKNLIKISLIIGLAGLFSCTDRFLEINSNPNSPEEAPSASILTRVQNLMSAKYGGVWYNFNESSSMAGHITKCSYIDETRYAYRAGTVNSMFNEPYEYISNLNMILLNEEGPDGNPNMTAIALILKCYIYQMLTDHLGAVPYTEAFQGEEGNFYPVYDSQESIYYDMMDVLKSASNMIVEDPPATLQITGADIIYSGNMTRWKQFANSLRLRMAVRMSYVNEGRARTVIDEILGNPGSYPLLASNADNARFKWPGDATYREPLSSAELARHDYVVCDIVVYVLDELNDPRLPVYAELASDGEYRGFIAGSPGAPANVALVSNIGDFFAANIAGYTYHMRYAEIEFLKAEIYERGLYSGDAETAYNNGVRASLTEYEDIDPGTVDPYLALPKVAYTNPALPLLEYAGNDPDHNCNIPDELVYNVCANATVRDNAKLKKIAYQKWLALYQQGLEAWAEVRRTDIPVIGPAPGRSMSAYRSHNRCPTRYPYAFDEETRNEDNLRAVSGGIVDYYWGQQMWWDKRTGIQ